MSSSASLPPPSVPQLPINATSETRGRAQLGIFFLGSCYLYTCPVIRLTSKLSKRTFYIISLKIFGWLWRAVSGGNMRQKLAVL